MSKAWAKGSTSAWRKVRAAILAANAADNAGRCCAQVPDVCTGKAEQVHHTQGRAVTGDDPRYLLAVCGACNRHIGDPAGRSPEPKTVTRW